MTSPSSRRRWPLVLGCVALLGLAGLVAIVAATFVLRSRGPSSCRPMVRGATAWDAVGRDVAEDGSVPPSVALRAFALSFGVPVGAPDVPAGDASVPFCGTLAVRWVRGSWQGLSPADRARVEQALSPARTARIDPPWGASVAYAQAAGGDEASLNARVATIVRELEARVGAPLGKRVVLEVLASDGLRDEAPAWWSTGDAPTRAWAEAVLTPGARGPRDVPECRIRVGRRVFRVDDRTRTAALAHELFHCFQHAAFTGTTGQWLDARARASWMIEGAAAWVGETMAGAPTEAASEQWWWSYYAADPRGRWALGSRSFEALGLFAHLDERGARPWDHVLPIVNLEPEAAFARLVGPRHDVLSTWASSTMLRQAWGSAWDQRGPVVRRDAGPRDPLPRRSTAELPAPLRIETDARTTTVVEVELVGGGDVVLVEATGHGRARLAADDAADVAWPNAGEPPREEPRSVRRYLCRADRRCACPDGRVLGAPSGSAPRDARLVVALAGGSARGSRADVRLLGLTDACRATMPVATPQDPCLVGAWTLDLEHARTELARTVSAGSSIRAMSGSYAMRFDASGTSEATLTSYGVTMSAAAGVDSTSEANGTSSWRWTTSEVVVGDDGSTRGVLRMSDGRSSLATHAVVRVAGRTMRVPAPAGAQAGSAAATEMTPRYACSPRTLTLDHEPPAIDQRFTR
ncbi:MAG: hypothetical protein IT379_23205 [Deltaproteobacteria bacterium]|nr:hypothetical protein [Deltaproteobacteria bacterium]